MPFNQQTMITLAMLVGVGVIGYLIYTELSKQRTQLNQHTEKINELMHKNQKLHNIIYAYRMSQLNQDSDDYQNTDEHHDEESHTEETEDSESYDDERSECSSSEEDDSRRNSRSNSKSERPRALIAQQTETPNNKKDVENRPDFLRETLNTLNQKMTNHPTPQQIRSVTPQLVQGMRQIPMRLPGSSLPIPMHVQTQPMMAMHTNHRQQRQCARPAVQRSPNPQRVGGVPRGTRVVDMAQPQERVERVIDHIVRHVEPIVRATSVSAGPVNEVVIINETTSTVRRFPEVENFDLSETSDEEPLELSVSAEEHTPQEFTAIEEQTGHEFTTLEQLQNKVQRSDVEPNVHDLEPLEREDESQQNKQSLSLVRSSNETSDDKEATTIQNFQNNDESHQLNDFQKELKEEISRRVRKNSDGSNFQDTDDVVNKVITHDKEQDTDTQTEDKTEDKQPLIENREQKKKQRVYKDTAQNRKLGRVGKPY